jgi:hypothetical protein
MNFQRFLPRENVYKGTPHASGQPFSCFPEAHGTKSMQAFEYRRVGFLRQGFPCER